MYAPTVFVFGKGIYTLGMLFFDETFSDVYKNESKKITKRKRLILNRVIEFLTKKRFVKKKSTTCKTIFVFIKKGIL